MWRVYKESGRPWPVLSPDPVTDYMIMEAVFSKYRDEEQEFQKEQKVKEWKKDLSELDQYRGG